jgi:hypothetical protein
VADLIPAKAGESDLEDDEPREFGSRRLEGLVSAGCLARLVTGLTKRVGDQ